jgi:chromosome segregation ATPase
MNWYYVALAFVSVCNLIFLGLAGTLLYRIVDATEESRRELLKAAHDAASSAKELMSAAHRSIKEMERVNEAHIARENSSGRVIAELSRQIRALGERVQEMQAQPAAIASSHQERQAQQDEDARQEQEQRAKLRADLNVALSKNKLLQDELSAASYRLQDATSRMTELRGELDQLSDSKRSTVNNLMDKVDQLTTQLEEARSRAKAAERLAEDNAMRLADMQEKLQNSAGPERNMAASTDHSGMIQDQQDQIDALASREGALLARISAMEDAFKRTEAEKAFIEERYLQIDAAQDP